MRSVLVALLFLVAANAQLTATWISTIDANWDSPTAWLSGLLPNLATDVAIVLPGTYTAKVNVAANASSLTLGFTGVGVATLAIQAGITANFGTVSFVSGAITIGSGGSLKVTTLSITNAVNISGAGSLWVNGNLTYDGSASAGKVTKIASNLYVNGGLTLTNGASLAVSGGGWANGSVVINDGALWVQGPFNFGAGATFPGSSSGLDSGNLTFYSNCSHSLPQNVTINVALVNIGLTSKVWFAGSGSTAPVTTFGGAVQLTGSGQLIVSSETIEAATLWFYQNSTAQIAAGGNLVVSDAVELRENATLWFIEGTKASVSWVKGVVHYEDQASVYVAGNVSVWFEHIKFNTKDAANFAVTIAGNGTVYLLNTEHESQGEVEFLTNTIVNGTFTVYYGNSIVHLSGPGTVTYGGFDLFSEGLVILWDSDFHLPSTGVQGSGGIEFTSDPGTVENHLFYAGNWVPVVAVTSGATLKTQGEVVLQDGLGLWDSAIFAARHAVTVAYNGISVNDASTLLVVGNGTATKGVNVTAGAITVNNSAAIEIFNGNWLIGSDIEFYGESELSFSYGANTGSTGVAGGDLSLDGAAAISIDNALTTAWINSKLYWNYDNLPTYKGSVYGLGTLYVNASAQYYYYGSLTFAVNVYFPAALSVSSGLVEFNGAGGFTGADTLSVSSGRVVINNPLFVLNSTAVSSNGGIIAWNSIVGSTYTLSGGTWDGTYETTGNAILETSGAADTDYFTLRNTSKFYVKHTFSAYYALTVNDSSSIQISKNVTTEHFVLAPKATYIVVATSKTATYIYASDDVTLNGTLRVLPSYNIYGAGNITVLVYYSNSYRYGKFSSFSVADMGATSSLPMSTFAKMTLFNQGANIYYQSDRVVLKGNGETSSGATSITASACLVTLFASLSYFMTRM